MGGFQIHSGRFAQKLFEKQTVQSVASRYIDYATPAPVRSLLDDDLEMI
jgi:hypothetical protein